MIKELTNIEPNNTTVINDVETPYAEKIGDIIHLYIGISASSLCVVRLSYNDDYDTYGTCSLEQLTRQQNMYAIHLSMSEFTDQHSSLDFRLSTFAVSATTCVEELSKSTDFTIKQWLCVEEPYTVTFDVQGHGIAPEPQIVLPGDLAIEPAQPTAEGYVFGGWFTEPSCANEYDFTSEVNHNIVLYAKWDEARQYTVTFRANAPRGYAVTYTPPAQTVEGGQYSVVPEDPVLEYNYNAYKFVGWYENGSEEEFDFSNTKILEDKILYAHWNNRATLWLNFENNPTRQQRYEGYLVTLDGDNVTIGRKVHSQDMYNTFLLATYSGETMMIPHHFHYFNTHGESGYSEEEWEPKNNPLDQYGVENTIFVGDEFRLVVGFDTNSTPYGIKLINTDGQDVSTEIIKFSDETFTMQFHGVTLNCKEITLTVHNKTSIELLYTSYVE